VPPIAKHIVISFVNQVRQRVKWRKTGREK